MKYNAQEALNNAVFEALEGRTCMSASIALQAGVLTVQADPASSGSQVKVEFGKNHSQIMATAGGTLEFFASNQVRSIVLVGSTAGDDYMYVDPRLQLPATILGGNGNDTIWGGTGMDEVSTGNGNDLVYAHGLIVCGSGNDTVWSSNQGDTLYAGTGNDLLIGGSGDNTIYGGPGNDTLISGYGPEDKIVAGTGNTTIYGSNGADELIGGSGTDVIYGGAGENVIEVNSNTTTVHALPSDIVKQGTGAAGNPTPPPISAPITQTSKTSGGESSQKSGSSTSSGSSSTGSGSSTSSSGSSSSTSSTPSSPPSSPPAPVQTHPAPVAVINQLESSITAGEGVNVDALSSTLSVGTPLTTIYTWNFGDSGSKYNTLTGWSAGHVYNTAGTYTITLTVTDSEGESSIATSQVTVASDNRSVIYVNNNGSDSNSGASPSQAVQTVGEAFALAGNNTKILFAAGQTFDVPYTMLIKTSDVYIGSYGSGANPLLMWTGGAPDTEMLFVGGTGANVTINGLSFEAPGIVTSGPAPELGISAIMDWGKNLVVENCSFLNIDDGIDGMETPTGVIVQDNTVPTDTSLRGFFCWINGSHWTILGNNIASSTRQHDIRGNDPTVQDILIEDNNLGFVLRSDDPGQVVKTTINFRMGSYIDIVDNTLTGAPVSFSQSVAGDYTDTVSWIVVQGNTFDNAQLKFNQVAQHAIADDNVFNLTGTADINLVPGDLSIATGHLTDITITDNTGINTGTNGQFLELSGQGAPGSITVTNNLFVAPNDDFDGWGGGAAVYVLAPDLSAFAQFSDNIWPAPNSTQLVPGVINYVQGYTGSATNTLTPAQWNAQSNVENDQFDNVSLPAGTYQITVNGVTAGAAGFSLAG